MGVAALSAYLRQHGHETTVVHEPKFFSSNSGPDSRLLARLIEPTPEQTAARVLATRPDVVAMTSYTITHGWTVDVARAIKKLEPKPIVVGGQHVSGDPGHCIGEPAFDAVVSGEGEGALLDLVESTSADRFARSDIANCSFLVDGAPKVNPPRALIGDLDALPYADKTDYYRAQPSFEREFYLMARRGCPYRCSFCEYSTFPEHYPAETKSVRRRSVEHVIGEIEAWKHRGRIRKVFFWDAIFTLDNAWMEEFAEQYRTRIAIPFECYTHPAAINPQITASLARAGCEMVRIGVQSVNSATLTQMDRRGDRDQVAAAIDMMRSNGLNYTLDHIVGLPGEGVEDQRAALRFYNDLRPKRIIVHWMTYFPGTVEFNRARSSGSIPADMIKRILDGREDKGFESPRLLEGEHRAELDEISRLAILYDFLPILPKSIVRWLVDSGVYRYLPKGAAIRRVAAVFMAGFGDRATRERFRMILRGALGDALHGRRKRFLRDTPRVAVAPLVRTTKLEPSAAGEPKLDTNARP